MPRLPRPCYHKHNGRWYVTLDGSERYLSGRVPRTRRPPAAVQAEYERQLSAWLLERAAGRTPVRTDPSVDELWLGYAAYCRDRYVKNGRPTAEVGCTRDACRIVARLYGELPAREFSPLKLKAVREEYVKAGWGRQYVNAQVSRVRRMFRWAVGEELIPESVWLALRSVTDLPPGRGLPEAKRIEAATDADIAEVVGRLKPVLADMVRFHRAVGCRADEATIARPQDFRREPDPGSPTGEMWVYTPSSSKNNASYWVGPAAQAVLAPRMTAALPPQYYLFPTRRGNGAGHYTTHSYYRAVVAACTKLSAERAALGLPPVRWTPLQIRHAAAEEARRRHEKGLEAAQARLAHKEANITQRYAHDLSELGRDVARRFG